MRLHSQAPNADFLLGLRHGLRFVAEQIDALP